MFIDTYTCETSSLTLLYTAGFLANSQTAHVIVNAGGSLVRMSVSRISHIGLTRVAYLSTEQNRGDLSFESLREQISCKYAPCETIQCTHFQIKLQIRQSVQQIPPFLLAFRVALGVRLVV